MLRYSPLTNTSVSSRAEGECLLTQISFIAYLISESPFASAFKRLCSSVLKCPFSKLSSKPSQSSLPTLVRKPRCPKLIPKTAVSFPLQKESVSNNVPSPPSEKSMSDCRSSGLREENNFSVQSFGKVMYFVEKIFVNENTVALFGNLIKQSLHIWHVFLLNIFSEQCYSHISKFFCRGFIPVFLGSSSWSIGRRSLRKRSIRLAISS